MINSPAKQNSILIIDDNPANLDMLSDYLQMCGFEVFVFESGESAFAQISDIQPDLILLDVMMPDINGFEICRRLKSQVETKDIPVIFMTALTRITDKVEGFEAGAVDYIIKPFQLKEIQARVISQLTIRNLQKHLQTQNARLQQEIVERKRTEKQLVHDAFHDTLTGLPNRALFIDHLKQAMGHAKRRRNYLFVVLFLDLDRFKVINDSLGHTVGDQLLITIARRLAAEVRPGDTVARSGGDEFAILLDDIQNVSEARYTVNRILAKVSLPINLDGHQISITASIGLTFNTRDYNQAEDFIRDADTAMYRAKNQGGAHYEIFKTKMYTRAMRRLRLENELRQAIEHKELEIYYQPVMSLANRHITGVEALLRWQHPQQGFIAPSEFIPLAEETGLIIPLDQWLLQTACAQMKNWQSAGHTSLRLAVNISARQFQNQTLPGLIEDVLKSTGLSATALELEITESIAMLNDEFSITPLTRLNTIGVHISIDDFGTGYSSLSRLKGLPVNALKIDQSFVKDITNQADDRAIITAIIAMARALKLKVIAEGVETEEQLAFLQTQHCDEIQGYLFSHPLPPQDLTELLQQGKLWKIK